MYPSPFDDLKKSTSSNIRKQQISCPSGPLSRQLDLTSWESSTFSWFAPPLQKITAYGLECAVVIPLTAEPLSTSNIQIKFENTIEYSLPLYFFVLFKLTFLSPKVDVILVHFWWHFEQNKCTGLSTLLRFQVCIRLCRMYMRQIQSHRNKDSIWDRFKVTIIRIVYETDSKSP